MQQDIIDMLEDFELGSFIFDSSQIVEMKYERIGSPIEQFISSLH